MSKVNLTIAATMQRTAMRARAGNPLPTRHVSTPLTRTCLRIPSLTCVLPSASNSNPRKLSVYKCRRTHLTCSRIKAITRQQTHTHSRTHTKMVKEEEEAIEAQKKLRSEFLQVLRSRRTAPVPLTVEVAKPVTDPLHQNSPPSIEEEIMASCPKADVGNLEDSLKEENLYLTTEEGEQGRLPLLILSLKKSDQKRKPAVVFLHSTNKYKEYLRPLLEAYASRGYVAISVDSRYHGERASSTTTYRDALISAWKTGETMPFIYDTVASLFIMLLYEAVKTEPLSAPNDLVENGMVWDLIKLADYLTQREDIDPSRIGITGISLGGMHAWFAAAADTRYAVVAPVIGVQGFRWAIDNDKWQARVNSIKPLFEVARDDLDKSDINKEVVEKVWDKIAPGLASQFDSPFSIPSIAPRPLLILNGTEDPRCPIGGLEIPELKARQAYGVFDCLDNFKLIAEAGVGHQLTPFQVKESSDWFDRFLKPLCPQMCS